ncbi:MAG: choice-of-anchor J domain-containing protein [Bacteroidetes bacterium]|nr:choice-of-anchor J domain-containing protein [Bacteroidota bacterium]
MKKLLFFLLSIVLLGALDLNAQIKLQEGFENITFPPTGWSTKTISGTVNWTRSTGQFHSGTASAFINYETPGHENWLVTKQFSVGSNDTLSFWVRKQYTTDYGDHMDILLSTTDTAVASFTNNLATIDVGALANSTWVNFKYYLGGTFSGNVYVAFNHYDVDGNGCWLDDVQVGNAVLNDAGVSAYSSPLPPFCPGSTISPTVTVKNYGEAPQTVIPVYYTLNGGAPVGPVSTVGPIAQNGTENVTFTGPMAAVVNAGTNTFRFYTVLPGDQDNSNDTAVTIVNVTSISSFPYFESFTNPASWTTTGTAMWGSYGGAGLINPSGATGDTAVYANFYNVSSGTGNLVSPIFNFSGLTKPVVSFYVAYRSYSGDDDALQVLVSTDAGNTWSAPVYSKSRLSTPSLSTVADSTGAYLPTVSSQWRHETIDLTAYAGQSCVLIAFSAITAYGNNCWVDDFSITNATDFQTQTINATGPVIFTGSFDLGTNYNLTANMTSIGPAGGNINFERSKTAPTTLVSPEIAVNAAATSPSGAVLQPTHVSPDGYYTLSYDYSNQATYDLSIDITGYTGVADADKLYIVKRADANASWVCLNTTRVGNVLTASGITGFSQFAIAGDVDNPLPVELSSFTSIVNVRNVNLKWSTVFEQNNAGFDIERKAVTSEVWTKIGNVSGNGNSTIARNYSYSDNNLQTGKYNYRLKQIDHNGNFQYYGLAGEVVVGVPSNFALSQNYPNPFNPSTKINYDLPFDSKVSIRIFDMTGREMSQIVNQTQPAGYYTVQFNASSLSSGIYFYSINAEGGNKSFVKSMKMVLVK